MAKNWVVSISPVSPYHVPRPMVSGSVLKAPRGCLSKPTAMPRSYAPDRMEPSAMISALPPVAHPLATLMKGSPVSPSSLTSVSASPAEWLPPNANCRSFQAIPASTRAALAACAPWARPGTPSCRPKGCMPIPTMATSTALTPSLLRPRDGTRTS
jgi:hypothetical protein